MANVRRRKVSISILIPFAIVALVFGLLIWKKMQDSREVQPVPQVNQPAAVRKGVLFFVAEDGTRLVREARELGSCGETAECIKELLDELVSGPVGELGEALPDMTVFNSVRLVADQAVVDLNQSFVSEMPSGSAAEMLAVYSIIDTVCVNYPQIARVRITVEGNEKTILRHLDLSDPLSPDFTLEQPVQPNAPAITETPKIPADKKGHP
jgi:spore germination protein GerM